MLSVFIIDDEQPSLRELEYLLHRYEEINITGLFQHPLEALAKIKLEKPDLVLLDIDMPHLNGIELALEIQAMQAGIIIIFVTAYAEYALDAFRVYPLDYILKPIDEARFHQTITHLLKQSSKRRENMLKKNKIQIRCFGRLEVTLRGWEKESMKLANRKIKELLAYLIYRFGRPVTRRELINILFEGVEDKKKINYLHVTVYNLRNMLESFGLHRSQVMINENYTMEIAPGICDYVDFVNFLNAYHPIDETNVLEAEQLLQAYGGAFLEEEDYAWAIDTREWLEERYENLHLMLAGYYEETGKVEKAEKILLRLLDRNSLAEEGWQSLLSLCINNSKKERYLKYYEIYAQTLRRELDEEPVERFTAYYQRLIRDP